MTLAHGGGGGGGAGGARRPEPDPVAGVWARVSPSLLRPARLSSGVWLAEPGWRSEAWSRRRLRWQHCRPKCGRSWRSWSWSSRRVGAGPGVGSLAGGRVGRSGGRAGARAPLRIAGRGDQVPAARPGGGAGGGEEGSGNLAGALRGRFSPLPPWAVDFRVVHCVPWAGVRRGVGGEVLPRPGLLLRSLPPKTRDKAEPSRSCRGVGARWGRGGSEATSRVADSLLQSSSPLFEGRAPRLFQLPFPPSANEKDTGEIRSISSSFFNNARCLPRDRSEVEAGWAVEGPREARSCGLNPERDTGAAFRPPLS